MSVNTKDITKKLRKLEDIFGFSNLDDNHELFSEKNKKIVGFFKIETPESIWIEEIVCLRSKMYSFKCGEHSKNKFKGVSKSQSKYIKLKIITIVFLVENIKKNVIIIFFVQLTMKCIFKK